MYTSVSFNSFESIQTQFPEILQKQIDIRLKSILKHISYNSHEKKGMYV